MKLSPILIAAAVAFGGTAMAQSHDTHKRSDDRAASARKAGEPGMAEKTKEGAARVGEATKRGAKRAAAATGSAAHRGADAMRSAGQAIERKLPPAPGQTRQAERGPSGETGTPGGRTAMGAGPTNVAGADMSGDQDRRARMDDAYENWRRTQGQR
jgi:hypothetical protein